MWKATAFHASIWFWDARTAQSTSLIAAPTAPPALLATTSQIPPVFSALKIAINALTQPSALCAQKASPQMPPQDSAR